jgi:hypothetical protein
MVNMMKSIFSNNRSNFILTEEDKKRISFFGNLHKDVHKITNEVDINVCLLCVQIQLHKQYLKVLVLSIIAPNVESFLIFT